MNESNEALTVLQGVIARLAEKPELPSFCEEILLACTQQVGAASGALFTRNVGVDLDGYHLQAFVRHGEPLLVATDPLLTLWREPVPAEESLLADERFRRGEALLHDILLGAGDPSLWPRSLAFHRALNHRAVLSVPLLLGGNLLGFLGMGFEGPVAVAAEKMAMVRALATEATVAFELIRLARRSEEAAAARARAHAAEEGAAELTKVNEALRGGVVRLVEAPDIESILDVWVLDAIRLTGATGGAVLQRVGTVGTEFVFATVAQGDAITRHTLATEFVATIREVSRRDPVGFFARMVRGEFASLTPTDLAIWYPLGAEYHRQLGNAIAWHIPFRVGGRVAGYLGLAFAQAHEPDAVTLRTLEALALQAGMTLELRQKSEEAREAAVARAQEKVAAERARELEETNALLARATQELVGVASPEAFVTKLHRELCALLGGERMSQFRLDWGTRRICGQTVVEAGRSIVEGDHGFIRLDLGFDDVPAWKDSLQEDRVLKMDPLRDAAMMSRWTVDFMRERGYLWLVNLPLFVRGRPAWVVAVMGRDDHRLNERNMELFRLLARQLTLALELRQLSEEARQTAAAREREQAAQARAAELALTNEAMRRGSEAIAMAGSDTAVMGALLTQATTATGAAGAAVKRRTTPGESQVTLVAISQSDRVLEAADLTGLPCVSELEKASREDPSGYYAGLFAGKLQFRHCDGAWAAAEPHAAAYHAAHGHQVVWDYPFREEGEVAGWISLAFSDERSLDPNALQVLSVLASHVALALKMIRLSALAREAAVNEERNRLAGEIHDSLAQSFAGIAMQLESAEDAALHDEHPFVLNGLRRAREVARFGLAEARRSVLALRPGDALAGGLAGALQSLVERTRVDKLLECRLEIVGNQKSLGAEAEMQLFRIAQEAVGNAVRHGRPTHIALTLSFADNRVGLQVQDNGCGLVDPGQTQRSAIGGLLSIHRRIEGLGGSLDIESTPGKGVTLRVTIPRITSSAA